MLLWVILINIDTVDWVIQQHKLEQLFKLDNNISKQGGNKKEGINMDGRARKQPEKGLKLQEIDTENSCWLGTVW